TSNSEESRLPTKYMKGLSSSNLYTVRQTVKAERNFAYKHPNFFIQLLPYVAKTRVFHLELCSF
ncbi:MAG: hypothetical protein O7D34_04075, partial [Ignavibacteria bacterium]|nr:hypothetical protein [Ignavibacteria bacterium]